MDGRTKLGVGLAGLLAAGGIGWVAGRAIQSPSEAAAKAKAPSASPITVEVERRALATTLILRGNVGYSEPFEVAVATSTAAGDAAAYVSRVPELGSEIAEGSSILEVSGRPLIALQGNIPMYRNLKVGSKGEDVQSLEEALARLGLSPGPVDGVFDGATAQAVDRMYVAAGATTPVPSDDLRTQLRNAQNSVRDAERALEQAQLGPTPPTQSAITQSQTAVDQAVAAAAKARTDADTALQQSQDALTDATSVRDAAGRALALSTAKLSKAQSGVDPTTGLAPSTPEEQAALALVVTELTEEVTQRQADLQKADREVTRATAQIPVTKRDNDSAIRAADAGVTVAKQQLDELLHPAKDTSASANVASAREALTQARIDRDEVAATAGITVPASEVAFIPSLPGRIDATQATLGKAPANPIVTVSGSRLGVESSVRTTDRKYVTIGMPLEVEAADRDISVAGKIDSIDAKPGGHEVGEDNTWISIALDELPEGLAGASVKITVPVSATDGEVLAVPLAALSIDGGGETRVELAPKNGSRRYVPVAVGLYAEGYAEVTPRGGKRLSVGDLVVVGSKGAASIAKQLADQ